MNELKDAFDLSLHSGVIACFISIDVLVEGEEADLQIIYEDELLA